MSVAGMCLWDIPVGLEHVCLSGKIGSDQTIVRTTRFTRSGPSKTVTKLQNKIVQKFGIGLNTYPSNH